MIYCPFDSYHSEHVEPNTMEFNMISTLMQHNSNTIWFNMKYKLIQQESQSESSQFKYNLIQHNFSQTQFHSTIYGIWATLLYNTILYLLLYKQIRSHIGCVYSILCSIVINNQKSPINNQKSPINHQKSPINHQKSPINNQKSPINHQQSPMGWLWLVGSIKL